MEYRETTMPTGQLVNLLRQRMARLEVAGSGGDEAAVVSSGVDALDRVLPSRGFRRGTLIEWLAPGEGDAAGMLVLAAARAACADGGALVVVDPRGEFYPPAVVGWVVESARLIVVRPGDARDAAWAMDQVLRSPAVAALVTWPERLDPRTFRRMQLAAEQGGVLGLFVRPEAARREASWADVRMAVEPLALRSRSRRRLKIHLLRGRGIGPGLSVNVEVDDETRVVHLDSALAARATAACAVGA